jgi:hypothetical protein
LQRQRRYGNSASIFAASVSGGLFGTASNFFASVLGGNGNTASQGASVVLGREKNPLAASNRSSSAVRTSPTATTTQ